MIKAAVIGVGNIGFHHARNYSRINGVRLVGIAEVNETLGRKVAKQLKTKYYKNFYELLTHESIDAISIAVPTKYHKDIAVKVMQQVKNVLIEKPISDNSNDAHEIIKVAQKHKINLAIGYVERFNPAITQLKKILESRKLGDILSINIKRVGLYPPRMSHSDVITDLATHDIDILNYLLGTKPRLLHVTGGALIDKAIDNAELLLDYSGIPCFIQVNWITPVKIRNIAITGSKGYAEVNYITQEVTIYNTSYKKSFNTFGEFVLQFGKPKKLEIKIKKGEPLQIELQNFISSIRKKEFKNVTGSSGLDALIVAENALQYLKR